jgi:hypothetical protein
MRETKIICNECGADMTGEAPSLVAVAKKTVTVKGISFEIEQTIKSISRLDDGTSYDICSKCRDDVLKAVPVV